MNRIEAADITYLVSNPHRLQSPKTSAPEHALGPGISNPKPYTRQRIPIPRTGAGAQRLRDAATAVAMGVPSSVAAQVWATLVNEPVLAAEVSVPDRTDLLAEGIDVDDSEWRRARRIVLGRVFESEHEDEDTEPVERFAVVAVITVVVHTSQNVAEIGWASFQNASSTDQLVRILTDLDDLEAKSLGNPTLTTILFSNSTAAEVSERQPRIAAAAAMCGVKYSQHIVTPATAQRIAKTVGGAATASLIVVGDATEMHLAIAAYQTAEPLGRVLRVPDVDGFVAPLRERLAQIGRIGPGLHKWKEPPSPPRPPLPITRPSECQHHRGFGWVFVLDAGTNLWWTRDRIGHGKNVFKTFRKHDGQLLHENEHNARGDIVPKHKGPFGDEIKFKDMQGCGFDPASHVP